jgi:hypothetical protein
VLLLRFCFITLSSKLILYAIDFLNRGFELWGVAQNKLHQMLQSFPKEYHKATTMHFVPTDQNNLCRGA